MPQLHAGPLDPLACHIDPCVSCTHRCMQKAVEKIRISTNLYSYPPVNVVPNEVSLCVEARESL